MPTVNIFYQNIDFEDQINEACDELKLFIADNLSGKDISLDANEVSIRLIRVNGNGMLADVELEITAHAFAARIEQQDEICLATRAFVKTKLDANEVRVWLLLPQLGHSWE